MAKDDYHVIVYQILAYLYVKLKEGVSVDEKMLRHDGPYFNINEKYWAYIMENLVATGLVKGVVISNPWVNERMIVDLSGIQITPTGIEFLCDNSFLEKAKQFLKDAKAIVPFV